MARLIRRVCSTSVFSSLVTQARWGPARRERERGGKITPSERHHYNGLPCHNFSRDDDVIFFAGIHAAKIFFFDGDGGGGDFCNNYCVHEFC